MAGPHRVLNPDKATAFYFCCSISPTKAAKPNNLGLEEVHFARIKEAVLESRLETGSVEIFERLFTTCKRENSYVFRKQAHLEFSFLPNLHTWWLLEGLCVASDVHSLLGYETPKSSRSMNRVGGPGLSLLQRVPSPDRKTRLIGSGAHWYAKTTTCLENTTE